MKTRYTIAPWAGKTGALLLALGLSAGAGRAQAPQFSSVPPVTAPTASVAAYFTALAPLAAASGQGLKVFSGQRGGQRAGRSGAVSVGPAGLSFAPAYGFQAGEVLGVSLTAAVQNSAGPLAPPAVVQLRVPTGGTGRGGFRSTVVLSANTSNLTQVLAADMDNDGDLDAVGTNATSNTVLVLLNGGNNQGGGQGNFGGGSSVAVPAGAGLLAVGDVDDDGDLDLLTCSTTSAATLTLLRNNGSGSFAAGPALPGTLDFPSALALGDLDGDGDLDLAAADRGNELLRVYRNSGSGTFAAPANLALGFGAVPNALALADVDGDHDLDLVAAQGTDVASVGFLVAYLNGEDATGSNTGVFANSPGSYTIAALGLAPRALALGDLDADGDPDVAVLGYNGNAQRLLNGSATGSSSGSTAAGTFGAASAVNSAAAATTLALADVDADGDLDVLSTGAAGAGGGQRELVTRFNDGTAGFGTGRTAVVGAATEALALADLDQDGDVDALAAGPAAIGLGVLFNGPVAAPTLRLTATPGFTPQPADPVYAPGSTYTFAGTAVGTTAGPIIFFLQNTGDDILTLDVTDAVTGGLSVGYAFTRPYPLAPGGYVSLSVRYAPTAAGTAAGSFTVTSNDPATPSYTINLAGTALATKTWTGAFGTDWLLPANWNPLGVPTATDAATVPPVANQPQVDAAGAVCGGLAVQSGATVQVNANGYLTVLGNLDTEAGNAPDGRFAMLGGTLELGGDLRTDDGFAATGGLVTLTGPAQQRLGRDIAFWNLSVGPAGALMARNTVVVHRLLTLRGDLETQNFGLFLASDAGGTAMVVNAGGRVTNRAIIERHIGGSNAGLGYRHLSAPIGLAAGPGNPVAYLFPPSGLGAVVNPLYNTVGNTVQPFPTLFGFDESRQGAAGVPGPVGFEQGWFSPATATAPLLPGRGYTTNQAASAAATSFGDRPFFSGLLNTGPVAVGALSRSGSGPFAGYHLLGNPYPAPIAWGQVAKPAGLDDAVYVFRSTGQYTGFYDFYVNGLGTLAGGEIAAMQGFFVRVSQPVPAFAFTDACRLTTYANPAFGRGPAEARPTLALALQATAGGPAAEADKTFLYFEAGATLGLDARYDAPKLPNPGGLNLAVQVGGQAGGQTSGQLCAVSGLPPLGAAPLLLPLAVAVPAAGAYTLAAEQMVNFGPGTRIWLRDALAGTRTALAPGTRYAFRLAGTAAPGRFSVEFGAAGALASAAQVLEAQVQLWPNPTSGGTPATAAAPVGSRLTLRDALGRAVAPAVVVGAGGTAPLPTAGLAAGLYLLHVQAPNGPALVRRLAVE